MILLIIMTILYMSFYFYDVTVCVPNVFYNCVNYITSDNENEFTEYTKEQLKSTLLVSGVQDVSIKKGRLQAEINVKINTNIKSLISINKCKEVDIRIDGMNRKEIIWLSRMIKEVKE